MSKEVIKSIAELSRSATLMLEQADKLARENNLPFEFFYRTHVTQGDDWDDSAEVEEWETSWESSDTWEESGWESSSMDC